MIKDTNSYYIGVIRHFQQLERGFQKSKVVKLGVCSAARRGVVQVVRKSIEKLMQIMLTLRPYIFILWLKKNNTQENNVSIMI